MTLMMRDRENHKQGKQDERRKIIRNMINKQL